MYEGMHVIGVADFMWIWTFDESVGVQGVHEVP
jgi:hypothetical protein